MHYLKSFRSPLMFWFSLCFLLLVSSCKKDEPISGCTDVDAENFNAEATVSENTCTYARDAFVCPYLVVADACVGYQYTLTISSSSVAKNKVIISNVNDKSGITLTATVSGNSFVIEQFEWNGQTISGNGILNGLVLTLNYTVSESSGYQFSCSATCNKQ